MKINHPLVLGILAHVDSGKTTLSEGLLYLSGNIRKLGRVDYKNAFLDTNTLERSRGITIFSKQALLQYQSTTFTLLDTPGHVDFSAEMERTLQVLDYGILVISGTEKVQSHTETLWKLLQKRNIPTFVFVNKMDMVGAEKEEVLADLGKRLGNGFMDFSIDLKTEANQEALALSSEEAMETYLSGENITHEQIVSGIQNRNIFPCYFGSALKLEGIEEFLQGMSHYMKSPTYPDTFGGKVFKITRDEQGNRLTHMKITGGNLKVKTLLEGENLEGELWQEKVDRIRLYSGEKFTTPEEVHCGEVCAVVGLTHTYGGQGLGIEQGSEPPLLEPVLTYRVEMPIDVDAHTVLSKLKILQEEDPQLGVVWNEPLQEIHLQLMGEIQLEILKSVALERFGLHIDFGQGSILYKETITNMVEGVGHFEPLRHYAEVHLLLEPLPQGSGLQFGSVCSEDILDKSWQRLVLTHLQEKVHTGVLTNSAITDMRVSLASGRSHLKHTEGGDFRQATYRAVRQGLMEAKSQLLEPWYEFTLELPNENVGRAMSDIDKLHGTFEPPILDGAFTRLTGTAPVATMGSYHLEVTNYTKGKGRLSCSLKGYFPCHNQEEIVSAIGYRPEEDLENTPDSVFCTHGAGYTVPWHEVKEKMHLESVLVSAVEPTPNNRRGGRMSYSGSFADEKELQAIFERTYGPIKERRPSQDTMVFGDSNTKRGMPTPVFVPKKEGELEREYLLVDGYNIIFAWENLKELARENLDTARSKLINILCNYAAFKNCELILVFDAYKVKDQVREVEKVNTIHIVYTKEAETADMYIEKTTFKLGKKRRIRVATSDRLEQLIILGHGAVSISADAFYEEVKQVEEMIREYLK